MRDRHRAMTPRRDVASTRARSMLPLRLLALVLLAMFAGSAALADPRGVESAPAPAGLDQAYARRVALVVGIDTYPTDLAIQDLRFATKDARDMAAVLRDPRFGAFDQTVELIGGFVSQEAFWNAFIAATATLNSEDTFVLYFAGHGTLALEDRGTTLYLLPSDGLLDEPKRTGISLREVEDWVEHLPARQRVLMVDACHSMSSDARSVVSLATRRELDRLRGPAPSPPPRDVSASEVYLYAAAFNQPAHEDEALQNGVYTHYLVEALQGKADLDDDGLVEVMELHDWVTAKTESFTGGRQVPQIQSSTVGREAIFLAGDASRRSRAEELYRRRLTSTGGELLGSARGTTSTGEPADVELRPDAGADSEPSRQADSLRLVPLHGFRLGYAYVQTPSEVAAQAEAAGIDINPNYLLFGWELNQRLQGGGWLNVLFVENVLVSGLNQSLFRPQVNVMAGLDIKRLFEVGIGADWGPQDPMGRPWHMISAVGLTPMVGDLNVPLHLAYIPDVDGYWRLAFTMGVN
jgi:Caspase domain